MGTSSGANFHQQQPALQTSLSLAASSEQAGSPPDTQEPLSNSDGGHDSATESTSSQGTWPGEPSKSVGTAVAAAPITAVRIVDKEEIVGNGVSELQVVPSAGTITLWEVARDRVDIDAEKIRVMSEELLEEIKTELRSIPEGTAGSHYIEEFLYLQTKLVQGRVDLTPAMLSMAHHVQLEMLVAIKTGIQAFLHPNVYIPQSRRTEVFLYKRCRNSLCQSALPAGECRCNICANRNGFCNACTCVICNKFDSEANTCRWMGCDFCSHWAHTDCAIRNGQIVSAQTINKYGLSYAEMFLRCQACQRTSPLLGWVREVFQLCADGWDRDALLRQLDYVCKIYRLSEDSKERNLYRKFVELIERLSSSSAESMSRRVLLQALQAPMDLPLNAARMMLREVAGGRVDLVAEKMKAMREEELEELQNELIFLILKWRDSKNHFIELSHLGNIVRGRVDLAPDMLQMAHPLQLKFLVAIKTRDKRFMDPGYHRSQSDLVFVLLGRKCMNIHCLNDFQFEYCHCSICSKTNHSSICGKTKFCRNCMCVICRKYDDSRLNSCRWLRCQVCNHCAHTDCVISSGQLEFGMTSENDTGHAKTGFRCQACERKSEAFKSVRKTLQEHAPNWNRDHLLEECRYIFKIFDQTEDSGERKFFRACAELHASLSNGSINYMRGSHNFMRLQMLLKELQEMEDIENMHEALERILIDTSEEPIELSYAYLESITNGFSQEIGSGGFGAVYMGVLQNKKVAVKKLSQTLDFSDKQFQAELTCLRVVKHKNIVKFLGHCYDLKEELAEYEGRNVLAEVRQRFLCFEYVPNKSLHDHLNGESYGHKWDTCYQLIEGICQGLHYLHKKERIIHLDLKPQNILVDFDMVPKITDFGLSRRFGGEYSKIITKTILGSKGYMAPEYWSKGEISFQADIFSLGVIIRKLLCRSNDSSGLDNWHESLDMDNPQVRRCIKIAQLCVDEDRHKRPDMDRIIGMLSGKETPMVSPVFVYSRNDSSSEEKIYQQSVHHHVARQQVDPAFGEDQHWGAENAQEPETEPSNVAQEPEAEPSNDAVEPQAEVQLVAVEPQAEPCNDPIEPQDEFQLVAVEPQAEPSNVAQARTKTPPKGKKRKRGKEVAIRIQDSPAKNTRSKIKKTKIKKRLLSLL